MIIEQLTKIYHNCEFWHKHKLTKEQSDKYHERLLIQGNILTYIVNGELLGYLEFWRLNFEQFGRVVCNLPIMTDVEDLLNGPIAYISNMYITPDDRDGMAFNVLASMFLSRNKDAQYFTAFRRTKKSQPVQVYKREDLMKLYTKGI